MAACTFAQRIVIDLRLTMSAANIIAMSLGPGPGTVEYTARTSAMGELAAGAYVARMGSPGAFDDSDGTVGDQTARQWGVRYAKHLFTEAFQIAQGTDVDATERRLMAELEMHRETAVDEAATPVVYDADGELVEADTEDDD